MVLKYLFLFSVLLGVVMSQQDMKEALDTLPPELQDQVDETKLKEVQNKTTELFKEKCEKNGGPDAFARSQTAGEEFKKCINGLVNTTELMKEMEESKPNGTLDEVFKRYCAKTPQFKGCFNAMTEESKQCFSGEERNNLKIVHNITEQLADFICYKEGDRITLFIAESGPECIQSKQKEIQDCLNSTFGAQYQFDSNNITFENIPKIAFTKKECGQLNSLQTCMVASLESCEAPTTANIVESLFKFIRQATPCIKFTEDGKDITPNSQKSNKPKNSAPGTSALTSATLILAATAALLA